MAHVITAHYLITRNNFEIISCYETDHQLKKFLRKVEEEAEDLSYLISSDLFFQKGINHFKVSSPDDPENRPSILKMYHCNDIPLLVGNVHFDLFVANNNSPWSNKFYHDVIVPYERLRPSNKSGRFVFSGSPI